MSERGELFNTLVSEVDEQLSILGYFFLIHSPLSQSVIPDINKYFIFLRKSSTCKKSRSIISGHIRKQL